MATLPLKSSRNEQVAVSRFLWAKGPHPPYSQDLAPSDYHLFGPMKKMLGGQKFASDTEVQSKSFVSGLDSSQHRSLHRAFRSLLTDGTNV